MMEASSYLAEHLHEVPVLVVPCIEGRVENAPALVQAVTWGSIVPATWSFMLAARARGLGTSGRVFISSTNPRPPRYSASPTRR
jgi:hypothetical protein